MAKLRLENDGDKLLTVYVEPWGRDYWLKPSEAAIIVTEDAADGQPFSVINHAQGISVRADSGNWAEVYDASGVVLECGHQRPPQAD
jgi:hypothetical protein